MKKIGLSLIVAITTLATLSQAAPPVVARRGDDSPDVARRGFRAPNIPNMPDAVAGAPTNAEVGDADSFGRAVNFLGFGQPVGAVVAEDCSFYDPGTCVTITNPADGTSASYIGSPSDVVIKLPARAAKSLLCFTFTPLGDAQYFNPTSAPVEAFSSSGAIWRLESEVLNDPALVNPGTGQPLNGYIQTGSTLTFDTRRLEAQESRQFVPFYSRSCISGNVSRRSLMGVYGLSESQARELFRKPITLRFGSFARGSYSQVGGGYGVRIYGD